MLYCSVRRVSSWPFPGIFQPMNFRKVEFPCTVSAYRNRRKITKNTNPSRNLNAMNFQKREFFSGLPDIFRYIVPGVPKKVSPFEQFPRNDHCLVLNDVHENLLLEGKLGSI